MTDATRGLVRYEPEPRYIGSGEYVGDMAPADDGDWVRYEDAARIQRARARNLVGRLRARGLLIADALEKRSGYSCEGWDDFDRRLYTRSRWCVDTADRISAKYLGEGT